MKIELTRQSEEAGQDWFPVAGFDKYEISKEGRIRHKKNKNVLKPAVKNGRYEAVSLQINGENKRLYQEIHRLMAKTFIPNPLNKPTVDHKDRNSLNNQVENLRWATYSEQNKNRTLKEKRIFATNPIVRCDPVTGDILETFDSISAAAEKYTGNKRSTVTIHNGLKGKIVYGFKWELVPHSPIVGEMWKDIDPALIEGTVGYKISSEGRLCNHRGRVTAGFEGSRGYLWHKVKGVAHQTHVLVAKTFLPNFKNKPNVNHRNGHKKNSRLYNLEFSTPSEQGLHKFHGNNNLT